MSISIFESLETNDIGPAVKTWVAEAKRRRDDVRAGRVEPIAGEDALLDVRNSIYISRVGNSLQS